MNIRDEIRKRQDNYPDLVINRLPVNTKKEFLEFAKEEFANDWGFALKYLWDYYKGIMMTGNEDILMRQDAMERRIVALESKIFSMEGKDTPKKKVRRMISGNIIERKGE